MSAKDRFTELLKVKEKESIIVEVSGRRKWGDFTPRAGAGLQGKLALMPLYALFSAHTLALQTRPSLAASTPRTIP